MQSIVYSFMTKDIKEDAAGKGKTIEGIAETAS
jgi:hypothetical protein